MKGLKYFILTLIIFCFSLSGCESKENFISNEISIKYYEPQYIWVSPDGVEYWVVDSGSNSKMAPRYDRYGHIVLYEGSNND